MQFNKYFTIVIVSLSSLVLWSYSAQAQGNASSSILGTSEKLSFEQKKNCVNSYKKSLGSNSEFNSTENRELIFEIEDCKF